MYKENPTKNIITKQTIAKELLAKNRTDRTVLSVIAVALAAIVGIIFFAIYNFGLKGNDVHVIAYVIYYAVMIACFIPSVISILLVLLLLKNDKKLKKGEFFVITDTVVNKYEKTVRSSGRGTYYTAKTVHFRRYGDVKVNSTTYQMASNEEVFYMVVYDMDAITPQKIYPADLYEYKE